MALRKNRPHRKNRLHHNNSNRTKREWNNRVYGRQNWDTTKNSHRDTQDLKTKTHREKRERERERERKRERDFAPSFPVTAGPPGPKYTVTGTCASRDGRAPPGVCDSSQSHRPLGSPACRPFKGTCATEFGPVNTGLAKERALAWRSLSPKSLVEKSLLTEPGPQVASQGLRGRRFLSTEVFPWPTAKEAP